MAEPSEFVNILTGALDNVGNADKVPDVFASLIALIRDLNKRLTIAEMTIEAWSDHDPEGDEDEDDE